MRARIRFEAARDIDRKIRRAAVDAGDLERVTAAIAGKARELAPFERIASQIDGYVEDADEGLVGIVESRDWISHFWEFGTAGHEARPFLRPAAVARLE